jgi:hypothetical protein
MQGEASLSLETALEYLKRYDVEMMKVKVEDLVRRHHYLLLKKGEGEDMLTQYEIDEIYMYPKKMMDFEGVFHIRNAWIEVIHSNWPEHVATH